MRREVRYGLVSAGGVALVALTLSNASLHAAPPGSTAPIRGYYLTTGNFTGSQALTACASGYHMASIFEISTPALLRYETSLGRNEADSGTGPPSASQHGSNPGNGGWVRTGAEPGIDQTWSDKNCSVWTTSSAGAWGTAATFAVTVASHPSPGLATLQIECNSTVVGVWCIQD